MSVWGFVQSVTRNLDEAAGLSNGAAANHHADPTVDVGGATKPAAWGEDDDELAFDDTVVAPHTGVSSAAEVEGETTSDVGASDAVARPVTAASTPPAESESPQVVEKPHPPTTASAPAVPSADAIHVAALSGQTERLSRALAKAETENARLQEELRQALALRASTSSREEQLLEEGRQLAAEVGRERERAKALFADKRQIESKLAQLQQQLDQAALREQQAAESKQLLLAERDRLKERLQEIQGETQRHATDTESTLRELDELRGRFAASREEHQTSVEALKLAHDHALRARDAEIDRLQRENDALRYEIQQAVVQCEKRVASAERDVVAATNRALSAESRCLELTQQTAEAGADVRQDVERLQSQLAVTAAARRHAEVRITTLETELGEAKLSLRDVEASLALKIAQQQEEIMTLRREVVTSQRQAEREKSRANALLARNEELTEEANRLLANLQAESARSMQLRLAAPPVTPNVGAAAPATSTSSVPASKPSIHVATEDEALIFIERLLMTNGSGANAGASTSGKVERALARATVELKDAQRVIAGLKRDLADLHAKHEVLLEMYGQQAEELAELTASPEKPPPPPPPAVA